MAPQVPQTEEVSMKSQSDEEQSSVPQNPTTDEDTKANSDEDSPYHNMAQKNDTDQNSLEEEKKKPTQEYERIIKLQQCQTGKVTKEDFSLIQVIGTGAYGKVLLVKKKSNGKCYAMKILKKKQLRKQQ